MIKIKYTIIEDKYEDGLPTYFVLKSTYIFNMNLFGELYGIDSSSKIPFQDLDSAETFKKLLEDGNI